MRTRVLIVVPARGGSKGIPRKNLAELGGRPLLAHIVDAAASAIRTGSWFDGRLIVSTDDEEIARTAEKAGAEVPFRRPNTLATDVTPSVDVVMHALTELRASQGYAPDYVVLLQPTAPFTSPDDILNALKLSAKTGDPVVGVAKCVHPPEWNYTMRNGRLKPMRGSSDQVHRRQDSGVTYRINGAVYVARGSDLEPPAGFLTPSTRGYVMPQERSVDIDSPLDLEFAEYLLARRENA